MCYLKGRYILQQAFIDSYWTSDAFDYRYNSGFMAFFRRNHVTRISKQQTTVALTFPEAEYISVA